MQAPSEGCNVFLNSAGVLSEELTSVSSEKGSFLNSAVLSHSPTAIPGCRNGRSHLEFCMGQAVEWPANQ